MHSITLEEWNPFPGAGPEGGSLGLGNGRDTFLKKDLSLSVKRKREVLQRALRLQKNSNYEDKKMPSRKIFKLQVRREPAWDLQLSSSATKL